MYYVAYKFDLVRYSLSELVGVGIEKKRKKRQKTAGLNLVNHQQLTRGLIGFAQIWYVVWSHDSRSSLLHMVKVKGSKVKITAWHNVSAAKNRCKSGTVRLIEFKLGKNYTRPCATRGTCSKSLGQMSRNNSAADCSIAFQGNLVPSLTTAQPVNYKCSRSKVKGQSHRITCQGHSVT